MRPLQNGSPKKMCEQAAALYVAAGELAGESQTFAARHYYLGVRDAWEILFRGQANLIDTSTSWDAAWETLNDMPPGEVFAMLEDIKKTMRQGRAGTVEDEIRSVS